MLVGWGRGKKSYTEDTFQDAFNQTIAILFPARCRLAA